MGTSGISVVDASTNSVLSSSSTSVSVVKKTVLCPRRVVCAGFSSGERNVFKKKWMQITKYAPHNDVSVNDGPHTRRWSPKITIKVKVKWSRYRPGVAQRVGRGTALLFHDRGTRRGWVVCSTPWPHFTPGKDPVPIVQEAGWATGPVWTGGKSRPHRDSIPDRSARSQSLIPTELPGPQM